MRVQSPFWSKPNVLQVQEVLGRPVVSVYNRKEREDTTLGSFVFFSGLILRSL